VTDRPGRAPFDAVLCDVDNVIRSYDPSGLHALERAAGLAEGTTAKVAFAPETGLPVLLGRVDLQEWVQAIAEGLSGLVPEATAWDLGTALLESPFYDVWAQGAIAEILAALHQRLLVGPS